MRALLLEMKTARGVLRESGIKGLFRKYGWKFVAVVFTYYLVRDVTLYILIPMFIFKNMTPS